ncbi:hypothetical protein [Haloplanus salilacus]|uniref:hypothetical protein n=1 Tax=Haloplanus salilacus TaxID=2949994 RepID=UPI0030D1E56E
MSERYGGTDDVTVGRPGEDAFAGLLGERPTQAGLTGWLDSVVPDVSARRRRRLGSGVVLAVGVVLLGTPLYHLLRHGGSVEGVLGDAVPLVFGAILVGTSVWLYYEADPPAPPVTAFWVATGFGAVGVGSLYIVTLHASHGHVVDSPLPATATSSTRRCFSCTNWRPSAPSVASSSAGTTCARDADTNG